MRNRCLQGVDRSPGFQMAEKLGFQNLPSSGLGTQLRGPSSVDRMLAWHAQSPRLHPSIVENPVVEYTCNPSTQGGGRRVRSATLTTQGIGALPGIPKNLFGVPASRTGSVFLS